MNKKVVASETMCQFRAQMSAWGLKNPNGKMVAKLTRVMGTPLESRNTISDAEREEKVWKYPRDHLAVIVPKAVELAGSSLGTVKLVDRAFHGSRHKDLSWIQANLQKVVNEKQAV